MIRKIFMIIGAAAILSGLAACESSQTKETPSETSITESVVTEQPSNPADSENPSEEIQTEESASDHEHSYTEEVTKEPTCEADGQGEITYTCNICGDTYTEETERIDHCTDDIEIIQEATCSQVGIKTYSCIFCGREFEREELPKLAHTESDWIVVTPVTATTDGLQHKVCTVCGEETASEVISSETFVVASGAFEGTDIEWKIVGTTLYVTGEGGIPGFDEGGPWFTNFGNGYGNQYIKAWEMYYELVDEIVLSEGITAIGKDNFAGFSKVTNLDFPSTLTSIGRYALNGMGLTSLEIPESVTDIGFQAFGNLYNLTYVYIPGHIKKIPDSCFGGCYNLSTIEIEDGVTEIGENAFCILAWYDLQGVRHGGSPGFEIYVPESVTKIGEFAFATGDSYGPITIYGKAGSYVETWIKNYNIQPEVTFVAR